MRKQFDLELSDEDYDVIQQVKTTNGISTDTKALRFIISEYGRLSSRPMETSEALSRLEEQLGEVQRSVHALDENVAVIMDAENTLLSVQHIEHNVPVDTFEAIPVREARENYREKVAHNRQRRLSENGRSRRAAKL